MTTKTYAASPIKLRNGSWGAKARSASVQAGDTVEITTKAGKSWTATVTKVVWTGDGVAICATESNDRPRSPQRGGSGRSRRGTWTGCSCGSVEEYERDSDCRSCQHDR